MTGETTRPWWPWLPWRGHLVVGGGGEGRQVLDLFLLLCVINVPKQGHKSPLPSPPLPFLRSSECRGSFLYFGKGRKKGLLHGKGGGIYVSLSLSFSSSSLQPFTTLRNLLLYFPLLFLSRQVRQAAAGRRILLLLLLRPLLLPCLRYHHVNRDPRPRRRRRRLPRATGGPSPALPT